MALFSAVIPVAPPVTRPDLSMGDPDGTVNAIALTDRYVTRDGRPWFPVMGEFHFSRSDSATWERELAKMKAGGVTVVATYVFWILHEEIQGRVRWDGDRDLRRFIRLAHRAGLAVVLRVGPWAHGEARNGGFPDWLQALPIAHRTDDERYLALVRTWFSQIEQQVRGLFHCAENPHAPIIAVQIENELYDQPDHLDTLRSMAEELGMRASLWVATGWGGALLPADRLMPVYAGYSDGFWESSTTGWPEFGPMHFAFSAVRDDLTVGADVRSTEAVAAERDYRYPFATCELGGGMHVAYHRRPLVDPVDVAALALVKLGSGSAWQGYYLYHGATQVLGELSTTQESQETGYPNDVPLLDYDFYAPIGALGQVREHYHLLRRQHLFLQAFGPGLAAYPAVIPEQTANGPRWAVRGDGERGFLFANNHQPAAASMPDIAGVQFDVDLAGRRVRLPTAPATLPSGGHFVWPLRQGYGAIPALSGTVQPVTQIDTADGPLIVFAATEGFAPELLLEGVAAADIAGAAAEELPDGVVRALPTAAPGIDCVVTVGSTRVLVLDARTASRLWRGEIGGVDSLVVWDGALTFGDALTVYSSEPEHELLVVPALAAASIPSAASSAPPRGPFAAYRVTGPEAVADPVISVEASATGVNERRTGGTAQRSSAPRDDDFDRAARVRIGLPRLALRPTDQAILTLEWVGDAARAYIGGRFVSDQFWSGRRWDIDVTAAVAAVGGEVTIHALPWDPTADVYVDARVRPSSTEPLLQFTTAAIDVVRPVTFSQTPREDGA